MEFNSVATSLDGMKAWNANGHGFSFVISHESGSGPGFRGRTGFMASWRPIDQQDSAEKIGGSPYETLAEAQSACKSMAGLLTKPGTSRRQPHVNFNCPAILRKWVSLGNQRRVESIPYLLVEGTLDECLTQFMAKPVITRHLYEIHVAPDLPSPPVVLPGGLIAELARSRNLP
jgi:hypothetical protein